MEKKQITCIVCPVGCGLDVEISEGFVEKVVGNNCKRGVEYAKSECICPTRVLTTTVKVLNGKAMLVSVKSAAPLPKELLFSCMDIINGISIHAPVHIGDIVVQNILETGINIVATKDIEVNV